MFKAIYHYGQLLGDPWVESRLIETLRLAFKYIRQCDSNLQTADIENLAILDFGGYEGNLIDIAGGTYGLRLNRYTVMDGDMHALAVAEQKGAHTIYRSLDDGDSYENDKEYDVIFATEVLEHLVAPRQILENLLLMLKKDGLLIVSLPNENTIIHRIYAVLGLGVDSEAFNLYKHLHMPTIRQSRDFLLTKALIVDEQYYFAFSGGSTRFPIFNLQPHLFWGKTLMQLGKYFPNLLARGTIFALRRRS